MLAFLIYYLVAAAICFTFTKVILEASNDGFQEFFRIATWIPIANCFIAIGVIFLVCIAFIKEI